MCSRRRRRKRPVRISLSSVAGPFIGRTTGRVPAVGRDYLKFDVLDLPLLSETDDVSHFLHAIVREPGL